MCKVQRHYHKNVDQARPVGSRPPRKEAKAKGCHRLPKRGLPATSVTNSDDRFVSQYQSEACIFSKPFD